MKQKQIQENENITNINKDDEVKDSSKFTKNINDTKLQTKH